MLFGWHSQIMFYCAGTFMDAVDASFVDFDCFVFWRVSPWGLVTVCNFPCQYSQRQRKPNRRVEIDLNRCAPCQTTRPFFGSKRQELLRTRFSCAAQKQPNRLGASSGAPWSTDHGLKSCGAPNRFGSLSCPKAGIIRT